MNESIIREIIKVLPYRTMSTFANSIKHLLECKLWHLIHFLNNYRLISQLVVIWSEITFVISQVIHLIRVMTKVRLEPTTFYLVNCDLLSNSA